MTSKTDPFQGDWIIHDGCAVHRTGLVLLMESDHNSGLNATPINGEIWLQHPDHTGILLSALIAGAIDAYKITGLKIH